MEPVKKQKSGSKVGRFPKTDKRYWAAKVVQRAYRRNGQVLKELDFSAKVQFKGKRHRFMLGSPNRATAAAKAQRIYMSLLERGWDDTMTEFAPETQKQTVDLPESTTVGQLIDAVFAVSSARDVTLEAYAKAFRKIVGDIHAVDGEAKFDAKKGSQIWREKIHAVPLESITPSEIQKWRIGFLRAAGDAPDKQRSAKTTANSLLRNAKSLFAKKNLPFLAERVTLPSPLPFESVIMEKAQSMRYHSKIDAEELLGAAFEELENEFPESLKILLLSLMCGLRKSEIDTLLWSAFDFGKARILVEPNEFNALKSEDSAGEVELDPGLNEMLEEFHKKARGQFVIESNNKPRNLGKVRSYRADLHFKKLYAWLRKHGVDSRKPVHTLRKEFGALITSRYGIYAASRVLRHSDIKITVAHYADKKERVTVGLTGLLSRGRLEASA